jgi:hypothetical protein
MAQRTSRHADENIPNQAANRKPAEGSREDVGASRDEAGGITNRPLAEEQDNQERLPPRGESKEGGHA